VIGPSVELAGSVKAFAQSAPRENVNLFHGRRPVAVVLADGILTKEEHKCAFLKGRPLRSVTTSAIASAARSPKMGAMPRAHGYQRLW